MTLTLAPARSRTRPTFEMLERRSIAHLKTEVEPGRISLVIGCHIIGWFDADTPLTDILNDLRHWAANSAHLPSLGWPQCCTPWDWTPGEDVAVWHAGRLLSLVTLASAGETVTRRFDR